MINVSSGKIKMDHALIATRAMNLEMADVLPSIHFVLKKVIREFVIAVQTVIISGTRVFVCLLMATAKTTK